MTTLQVGARTVELTSPDKVMFPDTGANKGDLAEYYEKIADSMLPHLIDRPLVLQRFPGGITAEGFMQKAVPDHYPDWLRRVRVPRRKGGVQTHLVIDEPAGLVFLAQQGCPTLHAFPCRAGDLDHPDELIVDLDPSGTDPAEVVHAARIVRDLLGELDVASFVKTTGSRGVHVHVDLDQAATTETVMHTAAHLARHLVARDPDRLTFEHRKSERGDRLYVDVARNGYAQHAVVAYTLRPLPGAPVATPVDWDEVGNDFDPRRWTITNIFRRLAQKADPWAERGASKIAAAELVRRLGPL